MKSFDEIQLNVSADHISRKLNAFSEWLDTPEEEIPEDSYCFYQAVIANNKINEEDPVVAEEKGTRNHRNHRNRYDINKDAKADAIKKARYSLKGGYTPIYRWENGETKINFMPTSEWLSEGEKAFWKHVKAAKKTGNRQRFDWKKAENRKNRHNGKYICRQDVDMFDGEAI